MPPVNPFDSKFFTRNGWRPSREARQQVVWVLLGLTLFWLILGGKHGFFALVSLQREKWQLEDALGKMKVENREMDARMRYLESHPEVFEKVAREKLMLAKPGELVYRFDDRGR
jgi:cell division protein FtsB